MPKPTIGQGTWGQVLNDHLDTLQAKVALDADTASKINTVGSATDVALKATIGTEIASSEEVTYAGQVAVYETATVVRSSDEERATPTPDGRTTVTIITGNTDQTWEVTSCTQSDDPTRIKHGTQSKRFTTAGAVTAVAFVVPVYPGPAADPFVFGAASIIRSWVWLDDPSKVSLLNLEIWTDVTNTDRWIRGDDDLPAQQTLHQGWNLLSWKASAGTTTTWGQAYRVRLVVTTTTATAFNVGRVWGEVPPKAQILFIEDRGYKTFVDNGLPDLRSRNIPVTWALDPMLHGTGVGTKAEVITDAQVATFAAAGDDISVHSYDGATTFNKTPSQIREDSVRALEWLQSRGYTNGRQWRAAWPQNDAPEHAAAQPFFAAYATWHSVASLETWPFVNRWDVGRIALHAFPAASLDAEFDVLEKTRALMICYTHGIHVDGTTDGADMTPTEWDYFISKVSAGITAGWLEGVTLSQLLARSGGVLRA